MVEDRGRCWVMGKVRGAMFSGVECGKSNVEVLGFVIVFRRETLRYFDNRIF